MAITNPKTVIALLSLTCLVGVISGCEDDAKIRIYKVPKLAEVPSSSKKSSSSKLTTTSKPSGLIKERLVGAIVPREDRVWFFKAMGPEPLVAPQAEAVRRFILTIHFEKNQAAQASQGREPAYLPKWTLPAGWSSSGTSGMRFDTIRIGGGESAIDLTITPLGPAAGDVAANVKRWAGQVGVTDFTRARLVEFTEAIQIDGRDATFVNIPGPGRGDTGDRKSVV